MLYCYKEKEVGAHFSLSTNFISDLRELDSISGLIHIHWNRTEQPITIFVDGIEIDLAPKQLTTTTYTQNIRYHKSNALLTTFSFNREFYCINDHDHEVKCNGLIFFGTSNQPIVTLDKEEQKKFELLYEVFLDESKMKDNTQGEMLRILLKRLIIKTTRLVKDQLIAEKITESQIDIIRKFNVLVDIHFKEKRHVRDYAELLFKSPKTLSNLFAKFNQKTPLQIIHERVILEAKRQLIYTDKSGKEIAHELGFEDAGTFHKLFKKITATTPLQFRSILKG